MSDVMGAMIDEKSRWKYMRSIVMDGNFSAEHLRMRRPEDDVVLGDGDAFMVGDETYKKHLAIAIEHKEVDDNVPR